MLRSVLYPRHILLSQPSKSLLLVQRYLAAKQPPIQNDHSEKDRIFNVPNCLTMARIAITPLIAYEFLASNQGTLVFNAYIYRHLKINEYMY